MTFPIDLAVGAYAPTYNGAGPLILEGQPQLAFRAGGTEHRGALFGSNVIEIVDTGIEAAFVIMTRKEWNATTRAIIWPWGTIGQAGVPFGLFSNRARALVFTAEAGSPAATLGPVTR